MASSGLNHESPVPCDDEEYAVVRSMEPPASPEMDDTGISPPPVGGPGSLPDFFENFIDDAIGTGTSDPAPIPTEIPPSYDYGKTPLEQENNEAEDEAITEQQENDNGEVEQEMRGTQTDDDALLDNYSNVSHEENETPLEHENNEIGNETNTALTEQQEEDNEEGEEEHKEEDDASVQNEGSEPEQEPAEEEEEHVGQTQNDELPEAGGSNGENQEPEVNEIQNDDDTEPDTSPKGTGTDERDDDNCSVKKEETADENLGEQTTVENELSSVEQENQELGKETSDPSIIPIDNQDEVSNSEITESDGQQKENAEQEAASESREELQENNTENVVSSSEEVDKANRPETSDKDESRRESPRILGSIHDVSPVDGDSSSQATKWIVNSDGELVPEDQTDQNEEPVSMEPWTIGSDHPDPTPDEMTTSELSFTEVMEMWKGGKCPILDCKATGTFVEERLRASHFERYHMECRLVYVCPFPMCHGRNEHFKSPDLQMLIKHMKGSGHEASDFDVERLTTNMMPRKIINPGYLPPLVSVQRDHSSFAGPVPEDLHMHDAVQYEDVNLVDQTSEDVSDRIEIPQEAMDMWRASNKCPVSNCKSPTMIQKNLFDWHWYVFHQPHIKVYYCPIDGCRRSGEIWNTRRRRDLVSHLKQKHKLTNLTSAIATQIIKNPNYFAPDELAAPEPDVKKTEKQNAGGVMEIDDDEIPAEFEAGWQSLKKCPCEGCPMSKISFQADFRRHWEEIHVKLCSFYVCPDASCKVTVGNDVMHYRSREWRQVVHHLMGPTHGLTRTEAEQVGAALVPNQLDNPMYIEPKLKAQLQAKKDSQERNARGKVKKSVVSVATAAEDELKEVSTEQVPLDELAAFEKHSKEHIPQKFRDIFKKNRGCPSVGCTASSCRLPISELCRHWKSKHIKIVPYYICPFVICEFVAKRKSNMKNHIERTHKKRSTVAQELLDRSGAVYRENPDYEKPVFPTHKPKATHARESTPPPPLTKRKAPPSSDTPSKRIRVEDVPEEQMEISYDDDPPCSHAEFTEFERDTKDHVPPEFFLLCKEKGGCASDGCFYVGNKIVRHWKAVHIERLPMFRCHLGDCGQKTKTREALKSHLEKKHHLNQRAALPIVRTAKLVFGLNPAYVAPVFPIPKNKALKNKAKRSDVDSVAYESPASSHRKEPSRTPATSSGRSTRRSMAEEQDLVLQPKINLMAIPDPVSDLEMVTVSSNEKHDILRSGRAKWIVPKTSTPARAKGSKSAPNTSSGRRTRSKGDTEPAYEGVDVPFEGFDDDDDNDNFGVDIPMSSLDDAGLGTSGFNTLGKSPHNKKSPAQIDASGISGIMADLRRKQQELEKRLDSQPVGGGIPAEVLEKISDLQAQNEALRFQNQALRQQLTTGGMADAWKQEKESFTQQIREKDATIRTLQDVVTRFMSQPSLPNVTNQMFNIPGSGAPGATAAPVVPFDSQPMVKEPSPRLMIRPRGKKKGGANDSQRCSVTLKSGASVDFEYNSFSDFMQKIGSINDEHGLGGN